MDSEHRRNLERNCVAYTIVLRIQCSGSPDPVLLQQGDEASHSKAYNPLRLAVTDKSDVESEYGIFLFLFAMIFHLDGLDWVFPTNSILYPSD